MRKAGYTFFFFKLKLIRIFSATKPLWIFAAPPLPPSGHTRLIKEYFLFNGEESQPIPQLFCPS